MQPFTVWIAGMDHSNLQEEVMTEFLRLLCVCVIELGGVVVELDHNAVDAPFGPYDIVLVETSLGSERIGYAAWKAGLSQATVAYGGFRLCRDYPSGYEKFRPTGPFPEWLKGVTQKLKLHDYRVGVSVPGLRVYDYSACRFCDDDGRAGYDIPRAVEQIIGLARSRQSV